MRYVAKHPLRTLGHIGSAMLLLVPGVITTPLLAIVGFSGSGVIAGKAVLDAKRYQTKLIDDCRVACCWGAVGYGCSNCRKHVCGLAVCGGKYMSVFGVEYC